MKMIKYKTLAELYTFLESDTKRKARDWELTNNFRRFYDSLNDEEDKRKIKWEIAAFDFMLIYGRVDPVHSSTTEDGTVVFAYPSFENFEDGGIDYLETRAGEVRNDFLIARYNQILWNCPSKHRSNAICAVDAYLRLLNKGKWTGVRRNDEMSCIEMLRNSLTLAVQAKHKIEEHKILCQSLLFDKGKLDNGMKVFVLELMLEFPQFKTVEFNGALDLLKNITAKVKFANKQPNYHFRQKIYETAIIIAQKCKSDTKIWNKRIGDALVASAKSRIDDETKMIPLSFYQQAIPYYKKAGLSKKVRETEQQYFDLKKELKLDKFSIPLEEERAKELDDYFDKRVKKLLQGSSKDILGYILIGKDIFPSHEWLKKKSEDIQPSFLDSINQLKFDINNNLGNQNSTKASQAKAKIIKNYEYYINFAVLPFLHKIFIQGIKAGKVNFHETIKFIIDNTWLGQTLTETDLDGETTYYNWVSLIAPALHNYFIQTESALKSNVPNTNYILAIDSLALKFEGMLRDFARILGIGTTVSGKGNVMREMYIEEMLALDKIKDVFDEDDRLLFQYLFISKDGLNLRNNIAHGFFRYNNYSFQLMHLMICALLRIGKYKIRRKK